MKNYVVLQTGENQDLFPVTTSEGVFVENGTKKLTNKLEEFNQSIEDPGFILQLFSYIEPASSNPQIFQLILIQLFYYQH